ncbi:MAG: hypothetical protein HPM95_10915 [Alphaproteobacteria bacterium]|nr:hypothetical protein [Alphaproteobacteria bacterium]
MLTRRHLLGTFALAATTLAASVAVRPTSARAVPDLEPVLSGRFAGDRALFLRMRGLSGTLIDLRTGYIGPFGYERGAWRRRALASWRQAYGETPDAGFAAARCEVPAFLERPTAAGSPMPRRRPSSARRRALPTGRPGSASARTAGSMRT